MLHKNIFTCALHIFTDKKLKQIIKSKKPIHIFNSSPKMY